MGIFFIQSNSFSSARYYKQCVDKGVGICVFTSLSSNYDRPRGIVFSDTINMNKHSLGAWIQLLSMIDTAVGLITAVLISIKRRPCNLERSLVRKNFR